MQCFFLSSIFLSGTHQVRCCHFFIVEIIKVWIWYRCQNRIGNYYHQDEEQLGFHKKVHRAWENHRYQNTQYEQKRGCSCDFTSQETNEF